MPPAPEWTEGIWDALEEGAHYPIEGDEEQDDFHGKQNIAPEIVAALQELKEKINEHWHGN